MDETTPPQDEQHFVQDGSHPVRVSFKPTVENPRQSFEDRREYSKALADAAAEIKRLREVADTDALTNLPNKGVFQRELPRLFGLAKQQGAPLAVMLFDITGQKRVNDELGHVKGDELLCLFADVSRPMVREGDIIGRFGGDEFYAILPGYAPLPGQTIDELNAEREAKFYADFNAGLQRIGIPERLHVGIGMGIAVFDPETDTLESLVERADSTMMIKKGATRRSLDERGIHFDDSRVESPA